MTENLGEDCTEEFMQIQQIFDEKYQGDQGDEGDHGGNEEDKVRDVTPDTSPLTNQNE